MTAKILLAQFNPGMVIIGTPPDGTDGEAYSFTFTADGGTSPYTWAIIGGSLPAGLSLNTSTGEISGTPTTVDDYSFTIEATDALGESASVGIGISIQAGAPWSPAALFEGGQQGYWLDISDTTTLFTDDAGTIEAGEGDSVRLIKDKSPNGHDHSLVNDTPVLRKDGAGRFYLDFNGNDILGTAHHADLRGDDGLFVGVGMLSSQTGTNKGIVGKWSSNWILLNNSLGSDAAGEFLIKNSGGSNVAVQTDADITDGVAHVFAGIYDQANLKVGRDGVWKTGPAITAIHTSTPTVEVGSYSGTGVTYDGSLYGVICISREPTAQELSDIENYLAEQCGATLA